VPRTVPRVSGRDLLMPNAERYSGQRGPTVEIQVKAATDVGARTSWPLPGVTELIAASGHEWFVFVLLPKVPAAPRAFVVPCDHVSAATWIVHEDWRTDPSVPEGR
jgi:hypothetical protein